MKFAIFTATLCRLRILPSTTGFATYTASARTITGDLGWHLLKPGLVVIRHLNILWAGRHRYIPTRLLFLLLGLWRSLTPVSCFGPSSHIVLIYSRTWRLPII